MSDSNEDDSKTSDSSPSGTPCSTSKVDSDVIEQILGQMKSKFNCEIKDTENIDVDSEVQGESSTELSEPLLLDSSEIKSDFLLQNTGLIENDKNDQNNVNIDDSKKASEESDDIVVGDVKLEQSEEVDQVCIDDISTSKTKENVDSHDGTSTSSNVDQEAVLNLKEEVKDNDTSNISQSTEDFTNKKDEQKEPKPIISTPRSSPKKNSTTSPQGKRLLRSRASPKAVEGESPCVKRSSRRRSKELQRETVLQSAMALKEKIFSNFQMEEKTGSKNLRPSNRLSPIDRARGIQYATRASETKLKNKMQKGEKIITQQVHQTKSTDGSSNRSSPDQASAANNSGYTKTGKRRYKPFRGLRYSLPFNMAKKAKPQKRQTKSLNAQETVESDEKANLASEEDLLPAESAAVVSVTENSLTDSLEKPVPSPNTALDSITSVQNAIESTGYFSGICDENPAVEEDCKTTLSKRKSEEDDEVDGDEISKRSRLEHVPSPSPADTTLGPAKPESTAVLSGGGTAALCCCRNNSNVFIKKTGNMFCQALDSVDDHSIGCCNLIKEEDIEVRRPSPKCSFIMLCEVHTQRLLRHNCCPGCGAFCTQGKFVLCPSDHTYHRRCLLRANGRDVCPHCGVDTPDTDYVLSVKVGKAPLFLPYQKPPKETPSAKITFSKSTPLQVDNKIPSALPALPEHTVILPSGKELSSHGLPSFHSKEELDNLLSVAMTLIENAAKSSPVQRYTVKSLYNAAKTGNLEKLVAVLVSGVNPNHLFRDSQMRSALHLTCSGGHLTMVHLLVTSGGGIDLADREMNTPLMLAILGGHNEVVKYLIKAGACTSVKDAEGKTPLHIAAKEGNLDACHYLLSRPGCERSYVDSKDDGEWTPLVWAAEHCHLDVVRYLLLQKADPHIRDSEQNVALHWAAYSGNTEITEILLNKNADVNCANIHGDTPLHIAARENMHECVKLLLMRGARQNSKNRLGNTPIDCCTSDENECFKIIKLNMLLQTKISSNNHAACRVLTNDISRGKETNPIQCVNSEDDEGEPTDFVYVNENCLTSNSITIDRTITSLQSCVCTDTCTTVNCVCCYISVQSWYDENGRLEPNFNYSDPPMLFECNPGCACNEYLCNNRVMQRGITERLQVFRTRRKGWGVRTLKDIPKGSYVCEYIGEIISDCEADHREDDSYLFDLENRDGETYCLDARHYGNVARFINHMCNPNLFSVRIFIRHQDLHFPRIALFARNDIAAFEELGFDYGEKFWIIKYKSFTCACGAEQCRYSRVTIHKTLAAYNKRIKELEKRRN